MSRLKTDAIRNVNASVDGITLDTSGNVAIPNELQLADKIVHTGDTNTLIRFPSADTVSVETGGDERLRIKSDGNVDIGSGTHNRRLTVHDVTNSVILIEGASNGTSNLMFGDENDEDVGMLGYNHVSDYLAFTVNTGERLRINATGQVRLNTAGTPAADLHVGGTGAALNAYFQTSRSSGAYHHYAIGNSGASLGYIGSAGQISASGGGTSFAVRSEGDLQFCAGGGTERLRITLGGQVLVKGTSAVGSGTGLEVTYDGSSVHGRVLAQGFTARDNYGSPTNIGNGMYSPAGDSLAFSTASTERLRINSSGKCLIGRTVSDTSGDHPALQIETTSSGTENSSFATGIDFFQDGIHKKRLAINKGNAGTGGGDWLFYKDHGSNVHTYMTADGDMSIADGNLKFANTHGVDFSASESGGVSTNGSIFDDYEEGAWTPSVSAAGTSPTTNGGFDGHYTKIGREVKAYFRVINATVSGGSGQFRLGNLPFMTNQPLGDWAANTFGWYNHDFPDDMDGAPIMYVGDNSTHASGLYFRDNAVWAGFNVDNSSGLYYKGCISYTAD